jgi:hypothetical protein
MGIVIALATVLVLAAAYGAALVIDAEPRRKER